MSKEPKLRVGTKEDGTFGKFIVRDEDDAEYGPSAKTRKECEEILKDWKAYYASGIEHGTHSQTAR